MSVLADELGNECGYADDCLNDIATVKDSVKSKPTQTSKHSTSIVVPNTIGSMRAIQHSLTCALIFFALVTAVLSFQQGWIIVAVLFLVVSLGTIAWLLAQICWSCVNTNATFKGDACAVSFFALVAAVVSFQQGWIIAAAILLVISLGADAWLLALLFYSCSKARTNVVEGAMEDRAAKTPVVLENTMEVAESGSLTTETPDLEAGANVFEV